MLTIAIILAALALIAGGHRYVRHRQRDAARLSIREAQARDKEQRKQRTEAWWDAHSDIAYADDLVRGKARREALYVRTVACCDCGARLSVTGWSSPWLRVTCDPCSAKRRETKP